tara:strand:+ start:410 stop:1678 length:1269 start_codon:yes stop_codon:yes gene_type:complete
VKISIIQPSRNNLKYLQWAYHAIRKNQGNHEVEICIADDASTDGTLEWLHELQKVDDDVKFHINEGPERLGHTILYDTLINEVASHDICMIYHADMYLMPGALDQIEHKLKDKTIVSLTRIEPPLHPGGPEKMLMDFGVEPEEFKETELLEWFKDIQLSQATKITEGIFAPWAFYKKDFQEIGGHDPLYAPQSKEDSDIFNRFQLNGIKFIQTWGGCVYHMTCRGSRRNTIDKAKNIYEDSPEWLAQNEISTRNFIRKWGHFVKHDALMKPIIPSKYDVGFIINNPNLQLIDVLEPWCSTMYCNDHIDDSTIKLNGPKLVKDMISHYIKTQTTSIDLYEKFKPYPIHQPEKGILVDIDGNNFTQQDFDYIMKLPEILDNEYKRLEQELMHHSDDPEFELGNLGITITSLRTTEEDLIICKKQ